MTYRQARPNPYAVVRREDVVVHLSGIAGFDPATSVSSVVVTVPDVAGWHSAFAAGLRQHYGRVPVAGVPRLLRIRRKQGTASGFSLVDTGGCWLRFYGSGSREDEPGPRAVGLARVLEVAARQGDARGDDAAALAVLERGLERYPTAPAEDRAEALRYRAELLVRLGRDHGSGAVVDSVRNPGAESGPFP